MILKPVVVDETNYGPYDSNVEDRSCPTWNEVADLNAKNPT